MKRGLQLVLGILSAIPLIVAILGITSGLGRWLPVDAIEPKFDSHYRYITGYYLSLFLTAWWLIPTIEKHQTMFRIVGISIFFGGIGRVLSWIQVGQPDPMSLFFTGLELLFPLLFIWQSKISTQHQTKEL